MRGYSDIGYAYIDNVSQFLYCRLEWNGTYLGARIMHCVILCLSLYGRSGITMRAGSTEFIAMDSARTLIFEMRKICVEASDLMLIF